MECVNCARWREQRPDEGSVDAFVYEDEHWYAYHAPIASASRGQLFLVAKRHFLDLAAMPPAETSTYGPVLSRLCTAIKQVVQAERVYALSTVEGVPHFHVWLIPRPAGIDERGWSFVTSARSCTEDDALQTVADLRAALR